MPSTIESATQSLFRAVAEPGKLSLSLLARKLGLKPASLTRLVQPLIKKRLLAYSSSDRAISLNPEYGYVVGIDMGASHLHFAMADFCGGLMKDSTVKIRPEDGPRKMIRQLKTAIRELAQGSARGKLLAIAAGVPSPVDAVHGVVTFANNLPGWEGIHLARDLEREFGVPVFVENDANMAAIGEHWRGVARGLDNFIFIALGTGVGSGLFINGQLYRGRLGAAGELFLVNLDWHDWDKEFPETGQFEFFVSGMGRATQGRKALNIPDQIEVAGIAEGRDAYFVFESFNRGSKKARAVLEKTFVMLGVGIANIVGLLDPDLIVLGGGITKGAPEFMLATVGQVVHRLQKHSPPIKLSALEDKAQTYGAICSALDLAREAIVRRLSA
jgi:glucokinase